jgi:hypothetical protein
MPSSAQPSKAAKFHRRHVSIAGDDSDVLEAFSATAFMI